MATPAAGAADESSPNAAVTPTFLDLAKAGQAKLQAGDRKGAIPLYVAAIRQGSEDLNAMSVVHSQLGNCLLSEQMVELAIKHHQADLAIVRKMDDPVGTAMSWSNLGNAFKAKNDFPSAVRCFEQQLLIGSTNLKEKDPRVQQKALANLGHTYLAAGMEELQAGNEASGCEALRRGQDSFRLQLQIAEAAKDFEAIGKACGSLGNLFETAGNPAVAIRFYKRRLAMAKKLDDEAAQGRAHCNLGNAYCALGKHERAKDQYGLDLDIAVRLKDRAGEALTCCNIASTYQVLGDVSKTITYLKRAVAISEELRDARGFIRAAGHLGRVYTAVGDYGEAIALLEKMKRAAEAVRDGVALKRANDTLKEAKKELAAGTKVSPEEAAAALSEALSQEDTPRHKWTMKGTVGRVFGKKYKARAGLDTIRSESPDASAGPSSQKEDKSIGNENESHSDQVVVMRKKRNTVGSIRSKVKRLSSMFRSSTHVGNRDRVYLPSGANATPPDDEDGDDYSIEFDELIFTLSQLEQQAKSRQNDDLRQLGNAVVNPMFSRVPDEETPYLDVTSDAVDVNEAIENVDQFLSAVAPSASISGQKKVSDNHETTQDSLKHPFAVQEDTGPDKALCETVFVSDDNTESGEPENFIAVSNPESNCSDPADIDAALDTGPADESMVSIDDTPHFGGYIEAVSSNEVTSASDAMPDNTDASATTRDKKSLIVGNSVASTSENGNVSAVEYEANADTVSQLQAEAIQARAAADAAADERAKIEAQLKAIVEAKSMATGATEDASEL